jgi:hypothetical protein
MEDEETSTSSIRSFRYGLQFIWHAFFSQIHSVLIGAGH